MKTRISTISFFILFSLFLSSFIPIEKKSEKSIINTSVVKRDFKKPSAQLSYYIIISKKNYELKVYDDQGWYATYPCVFGSNDLRDKYMEGDKRTPEGKFKVLLKKSNAKWAFELLLDYPNPERCSKIQRKSRQRRSTT